MTFYPNFYSANGNTCLAIHDDAPNETILDLLSRKPFNVNIHCEMGEVVYGQIVTVDDQYQILHIRNVLESSINEVPFSYIRYISLPLAIKPPLQQLIKILDNIDYIVLLNDGTQLSGQARKIFFDKYGMHIWKISVDLGIKHIFILGQNVKDSQFSITS